MNLKLAKLLMPLVIVVCMFCSLHTIVAQESTVDQAEMMARWQAFATPGPEHARLKYKVGKWSFTNRMWVVPGEPPSESTGEAEYEMIMDGRYLVDNTTGSFNGMPFHGRGLTGYNNATKKYVTMWIDNMGTGFMPGEGSFDEEKKEWQYTAETTDPVSGALTKFKSIEKIVDEDSWTMTMFSIAADNSETKTMEILYKRVK